MALFSGATRMQVDATSNRTPSLAMNAVLGLCALIATAVVLWSTASFGAGVDSDSAQYLSAAESASRAAGWISVDGSPYTLWPPLFPSILAASKVFGASIPDSARWLGASSAFAVVLFSALTVARISRTKLAPIAVAVVLASSPALAANCAMALSEPLFLALCAASCWTWVRFTERANGASFVALIALSAAALMQRYVGLALIASIAVLLMWPTDAQPLLDRVRRALAYIALAVLPIALWFVRNRLVAGTLDGRRGPAVGNVASDTRIALTWLAKWFALDVERGFAASALIVIPLCLFAFAVWNTFKHEPRARLLALFPCVYFVAVIALRQVIEFDDLGERLLAPLVPATWAAVVFGADAWLARSRGALRVLSAVVIAAWFAVHLLVASAELRQRVSTWRTEGVGIYETPRWQQSPTVTWLRAQTPASKWLTNEPFAVFCTTGLRTTPLPVRRQGFGRLRDRLVEQHAQPGVAWFTLNARAVFPRDMLEPALRAERVQQFSDGEIYVLR